MKVTNATFEKPTNDSGLGESFLSAKTIAAGIGTCEKTVLRAYWDGSLPGYKLSNRLVRFRRADVLQWIDAARVTHGGGAR